MATPAKYDVRRARLPTRPPVPATGGGGLAARWTGLLLVVDVLGHAAEDLQLGQRRCLLRHPHLELHRRGRTGLGRRHHGVAGTLAHGRILVGLRTAELTLICRHHLPFMEPYIWPGRPASGRPAPRNREG